MARRSIVTACLTAAPLERGGVGGLGAGAPAKPERATPPPHLREPSLPGHRGGPAVLLSRRHGVGAVPPAHSRGRGRTSRTARRGLHGRSRRWRWPSSTASTTPNAYGHRPLLDRDPATPDVRTGPTTTTGTTSTSSWTRQRARPLHRLPAHVGRQVEHQNAARTEDLHARECRGLWRMARQALRETPA